MTCGYCYVNRPKPVANHRMCARWSQCRPTLSGLVFKAVCNAWASAHRRVPSTDLFHRLLGCLHGRDSRDRAGLRGGVRAGIAARDADSQPVQARLAAYAVVVTLPVIGKAVVAKHDACTAVLLL